jgi:hypothetical protein
MKGLIRESGKIVLSFLAVIMFQAFDKEMLPLLVHTGNVTDITTSSAEAADDATEDTPSLLAFGLNTSSVRPWIQNSYNNNRSRYEFCSLGESKNINRICFAIPKRQTSPASVYVTLSDRGCGTILTFNAITIR